MNLINFILDSFNTHMEFIGFCFLKIDNLDIEMNDIMREKLSVF